MDLRLSLLRELQTISPLRRASISSSTFRDYTAQVRNFTVYVSALGLHTDTPLQLDLAVSAYGINLYDTNPRRGNLQRYRYALFGIIFLLPELKLHLNRARQTEKVWDRTVPSKSSPPLSVTTVNAMCTWRASKGNIHASLAINLGFHGFLRANEICSLKVSDICFSNDPRLSDFLSSRAGCVVRNAKTGKNQCIPLSEQTLLRRLQRFVLSKPPLTASLFQLSYADLSAYFHDALSHLKLTTQGYSLHSLRHGGATFEWLNNSTLKDVMMKGRLESESSCKRYLNAGRAILVRTTLSHCSSALIHQLAPRWRATAEVVGAEQPRGPLHTDN